MACTKLSTTTQEKQIAAHSENPELESHDVDDLIESLEMMLEDADMKAKKCTLY
jgi:hypothetical protein